MIYPLVTMLLLVFIMFGLALYARLYAAYKGKVDFEYDEIFEGGSCPVWVTKICHNLDNLFQVPPIFYSAAILIIALKIENQSMVLNAWGFVISRYIHTLVHISINKYVYRASIFGISLYFLLMLWIEIIKKI